MESTLEILEPDRRSTDRLTNTLNCHPTVSTLLVNRDITEYEAAVAFLQPALNQLRPPDDLCDIVPAVQRIAAAIKKGEKILVFGDYDVDGVTGTCLLVEFLGSIGAVVSYYIPHRIQEGYSINSGHIRSGAVSTDTRLIITVDCGVSSREAVASAKKAGIDVVITDHHAVTKPLPEALAVINPNRPDCPSGLGILSGVGVVFYLVIALRRELRLQGHFTKASEPNLKRLCDLVALGTVADMVPLVRENRVLTSIGLNVINRGGRPGLDRLIEASRIQGSLVSSEDIAYRLAPRLNAAGRINHAAQAVELLRAAGNDPARPMAAALDKLNSERRKIERAMGRDIADRLSRSPKLMDRPALVLASSEWHPGITGITASRLARKYHRPVFLVSMTGDVGRGSGRSIPGIDIVSCLRDCAPVLERYGGHSAAAGLTVTKSNFNEFRSLFEAAVEDRIIQGIPPERIRIDCELDFTDIQPGLLDALELLQPFGQGNPEPLFMTRGVRVLSSKKVGRDHTRLTLSQQTSRPGKPLAAIYFNSGTVPEKADQVVFALQWNRWNGKKSIQAVIKYMK